MRVQNKRFENMEKNKYYIVAFFYLIEKSTKHAGDVMNEYK